MTTTLSAGATLLEPQTEGAGLKWAATIVTTKNDEITDLTQFGRLWDTQEEAKQAARREIAIRMQLHTQKQLQLAKLAPKLLSELKVAVKMLQLSRPGADIRAMEEIIAEAESPS